MIVRWGLDTLPGVFDELWITRPLLISTERWRDFQLPVAHRFHGVQPHAEIAGVREALSAAEGMDGLVALGGGSAIDTAKAVSSERGLPIVSIPTTYSGAEWTQGFGMRDRHAGVKRGGGGARTVAIVYEPSLTLDLPREQSAGTALNALAHCAEGLYSPGRSEETDHEALAARSSSPSGCHGSRTTATTSRRAGSCSRARCTRARHCAPGWASGTRWRRRSEAATAWPTGR